MRQCIRMSVFVFHLSSENMILSHMLPLSFNTMHAHIHALHAQIDGEMSAGKKNKIFYLFLPLGLFLSWMLVSYVSSFLCTSVPQWLLFSSLFLSTLSLCTPTLLLSIHSSGLCESEAGREVMKDSRVGLWPMRPDHKHTWTVHIDSPNVECVCVLNWIELNAPVPVCCILTVL